MAGHPWLERATRYCLDAIAAIDELPFAYTLAFSIRSWTRSTASGPRRRR